MQNRAARIYEYKIINFDDVTNENRVKHNPKWSYIPNHPYRILITGGSGSGKTNTFLNFINNQIDIDKKYLYAKDQYQAKYKYLINKREKVDLKHYDDLKAFIDFQMICKITKKVLKNTIQERNAYLLMV